MSRSAPVTGTCPHCGRSLEGAPEAFGERICPGCHTAAPLDEAATFERRLRLQRDYALAIFALPVFFLGVVGLVSFLDNAIAFVLMVVGVVAIGALLAHRHGARAVQQAASAAAEQRRRRLAHEIIARAAQATSWLARRMRKW